jgi:GAF domain-containing protein
MNMQSRPDASDPAELAAQLSAARAERDEALERQTATAEILKVIASSPDDAQPVFRAIADRSNRLVDGLATTVFTLIDGVLHLEAFTPTNPEADAALTAMFPSPLANWSFGEAIARKEVYHIADTESADERLRAVARLRGFRSVLYLPLLRDGQLIGVIRQTRREPGRFTDHHVQLLQTFADQAVIAIENTRLFNESREALERQTATADILKLITESPGDAQPVFQAIADRSHRLVASLATAVFSLSGDMVHLSAFTTANPATDAALQAAFPAPLTTFGWEGTILAGHVIRISDTETEPDHLRRLARMRGFRGMLVVPLVHDGTPIGMISVTRAEPGPFSDHQVMLLRTFADQAVIAIENVRLFNETREALEQQTATANALKVISRSAFDLQPVLDTLVQSASTLCNADQGMLLLLEGGILRPQAYFGAHAEAFELRKSLASAPNRGTHSGRAMLDGQTVHVPDVLSDPEFTHNAWQQLTGFRGMLAVPLMRQSRPIGAMALSRTTPGAFTARQIELVQTFADQALIAIENTRLFNETRQALAQQTATADVLKVISRSAFDLQTVLDTLVISASRLCDADRSCIFQRSGEVYRWVSNYGFSKELIAWADAHPFSAGTASTTSRVALEGRPIHNPDVLADPNYKASEYQRLGNYRTMLGIPLLREGVTIGVFILTREAVRPFTDRQIELVTGFADQAVIAIENVRLFDEVQARTRELSASLETLRAAQDRLVQTEKLASLGQLTAGIAHEIKNPLNFVNNFAALSADLVDELGQTLAPVALDAGTRGEVAELAGMLKSNLEKVVQHGKRADSIVKNMLLHSREGSGEHRPTDINALVEESLNLAYHGARAERPSFNVTLRRDLDPAAGMADVYPQEMTRVLLNLASNGFYATAQRKVSAGDGYEPILSAATKNLGGHVEIRIRDNGTGIPQEVKEKMFNPFFTTKPAGEGTGLGLSMSYDIVVKQHGGKIDVVTEPGAFTEFILTLPRAMAMAANT